MLHGILSHATCNTSPRLARADAACRTVPELPGWALCEACVQSRHHVWHSLATAGTACSAVPAPVSLGSVLHTPSQTVQHVASRLSRTYSSLSANPRLAAAAVRSSMLGDGKGERVLAPAPSHAQCGSKPGATSQAEWSGSMSHT